MPLEAPRGVLQSVGNYDLLQKIADGGMGSVYKGRHRDTGEIVAVKIIPPHMATNQTLLKRFEQEWKAANSLDHQNIVKALDFGYEGTTPYLVMEFVDGESLGQRLDRVGKLSEADAFRIIAQVAQGLHKAHKQELVHRDVKPDNILIDSEGVAKLADLGLVKAKDVESDLNLTRTGRGLGTPHFMAPEQFRDAKGADAKCDIYSLAATLYMAVTGELPFKNNSPLEAWMKKRDNDFPAPRDLVPSISERFDWAIRRAMSADPEKRPINCREFVEDLQGRSTRKIPSPDGQQPADLWYLQYEDENGDRHTIRGSLANIRKCLKDGLMGDAENVSVARVKQGPFEPLRTHPEYRDLVIAPAALPAPQTANKSQSGKNTVKAITSSPTRPLPPSADTEVYAPAYRAPAIDLGPVPKSSRGGDWITWVLVIGFILAGFLVGLYFLRVLPFLGR
jgi:serine/threonine protein kinase